MMQYRIGDRDPVTGLYDVIWPDGSSTRNGIKIFNTAHQPGDVVLVTRRSDGMMILDSAKAVNVAVTSSDLRVGGFGEKPVGYLNGQVFNNEEEVLPIVSIDFAPGSPTSLAAGEGSFIVRISVNRPQNRDLRVRCELAGTAASGDYAVSGLDGDSIAIVPAGELFFDVEIVPIQNGSGANQAVVLSVIGTRDYRLGNTSVTVTILTASSPYLAQIFVGLRSGGVLGGLGKTAIVGRNSLDAIAFVVSLDRVVVSNDLVLPVFLFTANVQDYNLPPGFVPIDSVTFAGFVTIPVGAISAEIAIDPLIKERNTTAISLVYSSAPNADYAWTGGLASATIEQRVAVTWYLTNNDFLSEISADTFDFTIAASKIVTTGDLTVNLVFGGSATKDLDYEIVSPHIATPAGISVIIPDNSNFYQLSIRPLNTPRQLIVNAVISVTVVPGEYEIVATPYPDPVITQRPLSTYVLQNESMGCPIANPGFELTSFSQPFSFEGTKSFSYVQPLGTPPLRIITILQNTPAGAWHSIALLDTATVYPSGDVGAPNGGFYRYTVESYQPQTSLGLAAQRAYFSSFGIELASPGFTCNYREI